MRDRPPTLHGEIHCIRGKIVRMRMIIGSLIVVASSSIVGVVRADNDTDRRGQHESHGGHWHVPAKAVHRQNPIPATKESLVRGRSIYMSHCATCHGATGQGNGPAGRLLRSPPANLTVTKNYHTEGELAYWIAVGRGAMPAWEDILGETQIWEAVNFLKSLPNRVE